MKKIFAILISILYLFSLVACNKGSTGNNESEITNEQIPNVENLMEKDYVHAWNKSGVGGVDKILNVQTENYALTTNAVSGGITSIGGYFSTESDKYTRCDFSKLLQVSSMKYSITHEDGTMTFNRQSGYQRVIESGRYVQRFDYNSLLNSKDLRWTGRMEISATLSYIAVNYEVHNGTGSSQNVDLKFEMQFVDGLEIIELTSGRGITLRSASGQGITVLRTANDQDTQISYADGKLTVSNNNINSIKGVFAGFGVIIIPSNNATTEDVKILESVEDCVVSAENVDNGENIPVTYDSRRGIFALNISNVNGASQSSDSGRNTYDRVRFTIKNNGPYQTSVPLSFQKTSKLSVTGVSPMIRDANTLEPTGIQVQISKNWHTHDSSVSQSDPRRLYEGTWFNGNTVIKTPANGEVSYEYTCAYGEWGGVYSASHGQLCLIGWGGANNMLWEESAMGSWGESITYDPDMGLGRSMIDDVRPFLVTSENFGSQKFNWSGNVGGANFLDYYPTAKQSKIVDLIPTYRTQAPNLTDVNYSGVTSDGSISAEITVNMGRTDDIVRAYYTIKYTFLKDVEPERLSFFKLCADGYADNNFRKYAIGDETGVKEADVAVENISLGVNGEIRQATAEDFWFKLYDSSNYKEENSDVSFIVRDYNANINGKDYNRPSYRIVGIQDGYLQPSCELTAPAGVNKIKKGSTVEIKVEYVILPNEANSYYGESDYMLESKLFGTYASTFEQVLGGKIQASATVGKVNGTYPVEIEGVSGQIVAQFTISGGLGYVPVKITGVQDYKGYRLQKLVKGEWEDVVQVGNSSNQNDYWQVYFNPNTQKYEFAFNVKNTEGLDFGESNEYRFVKV